MSVDIVFTCGGTGGHIYPLIALAQEYAPEQVAFIGSSDREDVRIIPSYGFSFHSIDVNPRKKWTYVTGMKSAFSILRRLKPRCVVSSGGYLTFSVAVAAFLLRIPIIVLEQNTIPGHVNRVLSRVAKYIFLSFDYSKEYIKSKRARVVGNPVRKAYLRDKNTECLLRTPLEGKRTWLVFGGSQGADFLNHLFLNQVGYFLTGEDALILITGKIFFESHFPKKDYKILHSMKGKTKVMIFPYLEGMDVAYKKADIVISRAGATTIAELIAFQRPAIFVPYPFAKDNHQLVNAAVFSNQFKCQYILEKDVSFVEVTKRVNNVLAQSRSFPKHTPRLEIKKVIDMIIKKRK